jgi:hypothetical protein
MANWSDVGHFQFADHFSELSRRFFAEFSVSFRFCGGGSRDGFKAVEFRRRADGHANTLTVIFDTKGNIFGAFTPLKLESDLKWKGDDSQKSFVFTLKNPHI